MARERTSKTRRGCACAVRAHDPLRAIWISSPDVGLNCMSAPPKAVKHQFKEESCQNPSLFPGTIKAVRQKQEEGRMRHSYYPESSGLKRHESRVLFKGGENQRAIFSWHGCSPSFISKQRAPQRAVCLSLGQTQLNPSLSPSVGE